MVRLVYSFGSAFLNVFVFILAVVTAYRIHAAAQDAVGAWATVPFVCLGILGAKTALEAFDRVCRKKLGYSVE